MLRAVVLGLEDAERAVARLLLRRGRPARLHAFSGVGLAEGVLVGGRVLVEARRRTGAARASRWSVVRANLLPFLTAEVSGAEVRVEVGGHELVVTADREGYVSALVPGVRLPPGRNVATMTPLDPPGELVHATVHVPDPSADLAVVSDVDDTIVDSGIAHGLVATLTTMLLREQSTRVPLEGAPGLYRALAAGAPGRPERPFFYLSTSPWNLVGFLQGFLGRHGFPDGPLVLTDWGPGAEGLFRVSSRTHKLTALRRLAEALPGPRLVLIGDSGQQDAPIYAEFCREHPGRVAAVYVRRAGTPGPVADRRARQAEEVLAGAGVPFLVTADSTAVLGHARSLGLVAAG